MGYRCIVAILLAVILPLHGWQLTCPSHCGTPSDPDIQQAGWMLLNSLEEIGLLKRTLFVYSDEESGIYEGDFEGKNWLLNWKTEHECELDFSEDEEEEPVRQERFIFSRAFYSDQEYEELLSTELEDYLTTKSLIKTIASDIEFLFDEQKKLHGKSNKNLNRNFLEKIPEENAEKDPDTKQIIQLEQKRQEQLQKIYQTEKSID